MITSSRIGRYGNLCNSMFQLGAVIGMAKKTGLDYAIPNHPTYYDVNYESNNTSLFDGFDLDVPILDKSQKFTEVEFPFHYVDHQVDDFTDMVGYFQSEKYFEGAHDEIKRQFKFKDYVKENIDKQLDYGSYPDPSVCTSLHIRLGDYTKKRQFHPAQDASYWQQAVKEAGLDYIVVFSDDVKTAKLMFGETERMVYPIETDPFKALYHMSLCKNNIICNSTFGWMGAWLGEEEDSVIVGPKRWFGPGHHSLDPKDIIPTRWKTL